MAQQDKLPDPFDRSINHPSVLLNLKDYISAYEQHSEQIIPPFGGTEGEMLELKRWFSKFAIVNGWAAVGFIGGYDVLISILPLPEWLDDHTDPDVKQVTPSAVERLGVADVTSLKLRDEYTIASNIIHASPRSTKLGIDDHSGPGNGNITPPSHHSGSVESI